MRRTKKGEDTKEERRNFDREKRDNERRKREEQRRLVVSAGGKNKVGTAVEKIDYFVEILDDWHPCSFRITRGK